MHHIHTPSPSESSPGAGRGKGSSPRECLQLRGVNSCTPFLLLPGAGLNPQIPACTREKWGSPPVCVVSASAAALATVEWGSQDVRGAGRCFWLLPINLSVSVGPSPWPLGRKGCWGAPCHCILGFPCIPLQVSILPAPLLIPFSTGDSLGVHRVKQDLAWPWAEGLQSGLGAVRCCTSIQLP